MKTLVYRNAANTTRVEVQADIFATVAEMQVAGFETRFTNMHISDTPAAIAMGINVEEIENGFAAAKQLATGISGIGMFVVNDTPVSVQNSTITLAGTSGSVEIEVNANWTYSEAFDTDLATTADNFVTNHAAAILSNDGLTVTHDTADGVLLFVGAATGTSFALAEAATTGDMSTAIAETVASNPLEVELVAI